MHPRASHARPARLGSHGLPDLLLATLGAVGLLAVAIPLAFDGYDNDVWFILSSGRQIVESGFPATNPWAVYPGLKTVIQQWVPDVLAYGAFAVGSWYGLACLLLAACGALVLALYRLGRTANRRLGPGAILVCCALALVGLRSYISFRPQVYTMIFMCLTLLVMERYRQTGRARVLLWLVPLEIAHVNFHASMAPIDIAIVGAYWLPNVRHLVDWAKARFARSRRLVDAEGRPLVSERALATRTWDLAQADYPRLPLIAAMAAMAVSMLVNPYGIDGALYLVHSFDAASYGNYIEELKALMPTTADFGIVFLAVVAVALLLVGGRGTRRIDLPLSACVLVLSYLGFQHVRNVWLVVPFAFVLLCKALPAASGRPSRVPVADLRWLGRLMATVTCVAAAVLVCLGASSLSGGPVSDGSYTPMKGVDAIDRLVPEDERSSTGIFCTFEAGGYLEWRGYQVSMDARPELWEPGITGSPEHYYEDYVDMSTDGRDIADRLERAGCRFVIANSSGSVNSYLVSDEDYTCIETGKGYQVWQRRG